MATTREASHSTMPKGIMMAWFTSMPMLVSESMHAPTANGFTVEPRQPTPAPSSTMAAPTSGSNPAANMVAASSI